MDADIVNIYHRLCDRYTVALSSALALGYKASVDYPILRGTSSLGIFEMFYDDVPSFAFYVMNSNGEVITHKHFQSAGTAEDAVVRFMKGDAL